MTALFTIAIFFFLLILVYPTICVLLTVAAWYQKRRIRGKVKEEEMIAKIEHQMDQRKNKAFKFSILLLFFGVAPFLAIWLATHLF